MDNHYTEQTKETILERLLNEVPDDIDKRQGSVVWDLLSPPSVEVAELYFQLGNVLKYGFVHEEQPSEYLELRCAEVGVERKQAEKAEGTVTFEGEDETVVPEGTVVYTDDTEPVYTETTEEGTINDGSVTVNARAIEAGADGNVSSNELLLIEGDVSGVTEVYNEEAFEGGVDEETDEALMERYFKEVQRPATSGNVYHYEKWALEVSGIGDVKVNPLWDGAGTVKVVVINDEGRKPDNTILDNLEEHIEENRPIGADVTVNGAEEVEINVEADVELKSGGDLEKVKGKFEEKLIEYLQKLAFEDPVVRFTKIGNLLLDTEGVVDYDNLKVNSGTGNVEVEEFEVAVKGEITLNELAE